MGAAFAFAGLSSCAMNYHGGSVLLLLLLGCAWAAFDWRGTWSDLVIALFVMFTVSVGYDIFFGKKHF